jgi:peptide/nickel transport system permease protein
VIRQLFSRLRKKVPLLPKRRRRRWVDFRRRFFARRLNVLSACFLILIGLVAVTADLLVSGAPLAYSLNGEIRILPGVFGKSLPPAMATNDAALQSIQGHEHDWIVLSPIPFDPNQTKSNGQIHRLQPPGGAHLLGTDDEGRDVAARMIHASRSALLVGLGSVSLYLLLAVLIGAFAGYFGGFADRLTLRLIETMTSFPTFFLILAIQGIIGATGFWQLILVIGLTRWTDVARLTRAEVLRVVNEEYVLAARALGLTNIRILMRHILPAAIGPAFVAATTGVADAILIESTLSFLGFGVPANIPSWGQLLTDGFYNEGAYWLAVFPGTLLFLTLVSINLSGEGLREAIDPTNN